jgi:hypothetical protein
MQQCMLRLYKLLNGEILLFKDYTKTERIQFLKVRFLRDLYVEIEKQSYFSEDFELPSAVTCSCATNPFGPTAHTAFLPFAATLLKF